FPARSRRSGFDVGPNPEIPARKFFCPVRGCANAADFFRGQKRPGFGVRRHGENSERGHSRSFWIRQDALTVASSAPAMENPRASLGLRPQLNVSSLVKT